MNKGKIVIVILLVIICLIVAYTLTNKTRKTKPELSTTENIQQTFLVEGYPIDKVPLYKLSKVSSNKIFVNTDPKNISEFDEHNFAYFNVVFYSDATQEEFLNYYKSLFESQIVDEFGNSDMVKGKIGEYKVSAAHYGSDNTGYIQVHLPGYNDENVNKYFLEFPLVLEGNSGLLEHEKSYGLLNQKGGEVEFTKYFTVIDSGDENKDGRDDKDEFLILEEEYKSKFKDKPDYSFDETSGTMKWKEVDFESTLSLSRDHGRIYLMLRKNI